LLAGPGCARIAPRETSLHIVGAFGQRAFDHQVPFGGCRGDDDWLAVNVFASPVLGPQRKAQDAGAARPRVSARAPRARSAALRRARRPGSGPARTAAV
jgi:hypothetical protein